MLSEYGNHVIILCKLAIVSSSYLSTTLELLLPFLFQAHKKWASHRMLQQFLQNVIFDYQTNITSIIFQECFCFLNLRTFIQTRKGFRRGSPMVVLLYTKNSQ